MDDSMQKIVSLAKRRGFIFPGSEIYGGLANSWDYGPLGVELKNNIKQEWWKRFVQQRSDMFGIDASLLMNPKVWEASGHLENFADALVECKGCNKRFRVEDLGVDFSPAIRDALKAKESGDAQEAVPGAMEVIQKTDRIKCQNCGKQNWSLPRHFNLMLKTFLGATEDVANTVYFRPETAQAMFVNFKNILDTSHPQLPFGIAQIGKAFRNEITPGNFIFRTREFEQMEIEYFVEEKDWEKYFDHWLDMMKQWLSDLGVRKEKLHFTEIKDKERAHYSKKTIDIEYEYPFGQKELYGLAYRGDFDLKNHMEKSGQDLRYTDKASNEKLLPHVIEPTWGVDRSVLVAMLEAYHEEEVPTAEEGQEATRTVMKFPFWLAPVKVAVLPLSKKEELTTIAKPVYEQLAKSFTCEYDETQSIGKRYRRQDEIGTPFVVTVDFDTPKQKDVTLRDRDTMKQDRVKIKDLETVIAQKLHDYKNNA
ncbi:MAG: glycine--tRNA ligase [Candidatus Wildermuthbacteria bacterium]|nr:glycine--tRNA ligase [Candidatus Wildermuthbacteria bacterium]